MSELHELVHDLVTGAGPGADLWATVAKLGLTTVAVPEEAGGSGGTVGDLTEVVEALGEHGAQVPVAEHATAAWALAAAGHDPVGLGTVAHVRELTRTEDLVVLTGVPWAARASHVLVLPLDGGDPALVATEGLTVTAGTDVAGAPLDDVEVPVGRCIPLPGSPRAAEVAGRLALLRSAAMVGAGRAAYELTRSHVRTREQFGRPLVTIPAVGSALARMRVEVIQAETALASARAAAEVGRAHPAAAAARVVCGTAATAIAQLAHQLHGAMGITMEYSLHPLTRTLWAARDADLPEEHWAGLLGGLVLNNGEELLWDELTAVTDSTGTAAGAPPPRAARTR
jgi:alkylation response protein AidB-like acyl-CoA dehydrogenase